MHVAFIGVGNMGRPMLANLLKKGFTAIAYDVMPAALDAAAALGAARASSPAEAAAAGDLVITILPSSGNVEAAYLGANGIIEGATRGRYVDRRSRHIAARRGASRREAHPFY